VPLGGIDAAANLLCVLLRDFLADRLGRRGVMVKRLRVLQRVGMMDGDLMMVL
jgi:hypothetical protein